MRDIERERAERVIQRGKRARRAAAAGTTEERQREEARQATRDKSTGVGPSLVVPEQSARTKDRSVSPCAVGRSRGQAHARPEVLPLLAVAVEVAHRVDEPGY